MSVDLELLHRRIKGMYWDNEPAPMPDPRYMLKPRSRRLGSATAADPCDCRPDCADPYVTQLAADAEGLRTAGRLFTARCTYTANTRSRVFLGLVHGPARISTVTLFSNTSGWGDVAWNIYRCDSQLADLTNDAATTFLPGDPLIWNRDYTRGIVGAALFLSSAWLNYPLEAYLPEGAHYLHALAAGDTALANLTLAVTVVDIVCDHFEPPIYAEIPEPPPPPDQGWPINWLMTAGSPLTANARFWQWQSGRWHLYLSVANQANLNFLPAYTLRLGPDYRIPPLPPAPGTFNGQTHMTDPTEWVPWPATREGA